MGSSSVRERIAIVFMTLSVVATLVLGGALAAQLGHPRQQVVQVGAASAASPGGVSAGDETAAAPSDTGSGSTAATPGEAATSAGEAASAGTGGTGGVTSAGSSTGTAAGAAGPAAAAGTAAGASRSAAGRTTATTRAPSGPTAAGGAPAAPSAPGAVGDKGPDSPDIGVSGDFITVGGIFDETGPVDATVERDVVRSYFNQVNAAGGVKGRKLRLLDCDSAYDPSRGHQCSQRLLSQKILGMVGWTSPSGEEPETKFLVGQGVPVIGGLSVPAEFSSPLAYPTMASLELHGTAMGHHAKDLNIQAPGVIIVNVNFIAPLQNAMLKALQQEGIKPVDIEQVDITKADYSDIIVKLRAAGAKSILAGLDPFSYARMFQAMERQNFKVPTLGFGLDKKS